ncbi:unnamed protein product [Protopolystoma xenopodis]|uniref:Uncharacterized protein n=1 Tax=Protopolystoma xenopodis TaxID=117903 RepID=A0A3S5FCS6_9PLAT|nr:unnamed protein product [Protopolystoma xenopodis]
MFRHLMIPQKIVLAIYQPRKMNFSHSIGIKLNNLQAIRRMSAVAWIRLLIRFPTNRP